MKRTLLFFACALFVGMSTASVIKATAKAATPRCCAFNDRYCRAGQIIGYGPYDSRGNCIEP